MGASNMSIQTTVEPSYMDRPSMKQDNHPEHNMPAPEHDGVSPTDRARGMARLRTQLQQSDAKNWMDAAGQDAKNIETLARGRE